jgi:hypothetical protein
VVYRDAAGKRLGERSSGDASPDGFGYCRAHGASGMTDEVDWCVVYVNGVESVDVLAELVAASTGGIRDGSSVTTRGGVEIYAATNSSNPRFEAEPPDETDFTWWPFLLELDVSEREGVPLVSAILRGLWAVGISAVAACSFEHLLPRSGGYRDGRLITSDE